MKLLTRLGIYMIQMIAILILLVGKLLAIFLTSPIAFIYLIISFHLFLAVHALFIAFLGSLYLVVSHSSMELMDIMKMDIVVIIILVGSLLSSLIATFEKYYLPIFNKEIAEEFE